MANDTHSRFIAVSEDDIQFYASGWPYDKTYEALSFVWHWNMLTLGWKCHTWTAPSCDIFNLGFIIFQCLLTTVHHLYNYCYSSLDSHDVGSLSVTAWPADEQSQFNDDTFTSSQVPFTICLPTSHNSLLHYDILQYGNVWRMLKSLQLSSLISW